LRIFDAATGYVVSSRRIEGSIVGSTLSAGFAYKNIVVAGSRAEKNPFGYAI